MNLSDFEKIFSPSLFVNGTRLDFDNPYEPRQRIFLPTREETIDMIVDYFHNRKFLINDEIRDLIRINRMDPEMARRMAHMRFDGIDEGIRRWMARNG